MGRAPARASEGGLNKGPWTEEEDAILAAFVKANGEGNWRSLPKQAGLRRCRKSCRLRWMNYLRPDLKRGNLSPDEYELIIKLHSLLGNRWSLIAGRIPGRTDNEIKNYWNSRQRRKMKTTASGDGSQLLEATPLSFDLPSIPKTEPESSCSTPPAPTSELAAYSEFANALADSSILPEFASRFTSSEATFSEPSSDGTCNLEESYDQYYSAWTPDLIVEQTEDSLGQANSAKRDLYAYSPESVLLLPQENQIPEDDFSNIDFGSFTAGLTDSFGVANVQKLLLSPVQRNFMSPSFWPGLYASDGFWEADFSEVGEIAETKGEPMPTGCA